MKIKILSIFLFVFIFSGCGSEASSTTSTVVTSISGLPTVHTSLTPTIPLRSEELSEVFFSKECQGAGYTGLVDFYPNVHFSPNDEWSFTSCIKTLDDKVTYPFIISSASKRQTWVLDPKIIAPELFEKIPTASFKPEYWNNNESILIIRAVLLPCPSSFLCFYEDGEALYEINLESGEFSSLLYPQNTSSYAFAVSHDGKYLGYVDQATPEAVHIRDLISGNEKTVMLQGKYLRVGAFVWTPDSKDVVFVGLGSNIYLPTSSLFLFNTTNFSLSILFNDRSGVYFPGSLISDKIEYWYQQDILYLDSLDSYPLYVNIRTKEISQVPTSVP